MNTITFVEQIIPLEDIAYILQKKTTWCKSKKVAIAVKNQYWGNFPAQVFKWITERPEFNGCLERLYEKTKIWQVQEARYGIKITTLHGEEALELITSHYSPGKKQTA